MTRRTLSVFSSLLVALLLIGAKSARASELVLVSARGGIGNAQGFLTISISITKYLLTDAAGNTLFRSMTGSIYMYGTYNSQPVYIFASPSEIYPSPTNPRQAVLRVRFQDNVDRLNQNGTRQTGRVWFYTDILLENSTPTGKITWNTYEDPTNGGTGLLSLMPNYNIPNNFMTFGTVGISVRHW